MIDTIIIMMATSVVFILGLNIGYKLHSDTKPVELPKIENIPFTKQHREKNIEDKETLKKRKELIEAAEYIERFKGDE